MYIIREEYLRKLFELKNSDLIKVVTGVRRCGKSTLFVQFQDYLIKRGILKNQIIYINFEDYDNEKYLEPKVLRIMDSLALLLKLNSRDLWLKYKLIYKRFKEFR